MKPFEFAIAFQTNKTPAECAALARLVDGFGFDVVSVYNDLLYQPALGALLWMAPHLTRARLGPAVLNPYTVHPLEISGQAALGARQFSAPRPGPWVETPVYMCLSLRDRESDIGVA